jgi:hypothetical protein
VRRTEQPEPQRGDRIGNKSGKIYRPAGAQLGDPLGPTAHAVGYSLPLLRSYTIRRLQATRLVATAAELGS